MKVLLAYATYSSGTLSASQIITELLTKSKIDTTMKNIKDISFEELTHFDFIIFASPSWWNRDSDGMPHEFFLSFMDDAEGKKLPEKSFAVFGLGDEKFTHFCGAVDRLEEFVKKMQGKLIVESLRIDGFYFEPEKNKKMIADWTNGLIKKLTSL